MMDILRLEKLMSVMRAAGCTELRDGETFIKLGPAPRSESAPTGRETLDDIDPKKVPPTIEQMIDEDPRFYEYKRGHRLPTAGG